MPISRTLRFVLFSVLGSALVGDPAVAADGRHDGMRSYTYSYSIVVSVRERGELASYSNVVRVRERSKDGYALPPEMCGEATAIKLRNGKYLFALLDGPTARPVRGRHLWRSAPTGLLLAKLRLETQWSYKDDSGLRLLPQARVEVELDPDQFPRFVAFRDIRDPGTVETLSPPEIPKWMGAVRIERVSLRVTGEPEITGHVQHILPWLKSSSTYLDGSQSGVRVGGLHPWQFMQCM